MRPRRKMGTLSSSTNCFSNPDKYLMPKSGHSADTSYWLALALIHNGDHDFNPDKLAKVIGCKASEVSKIVKKLMQAGFVECGKRGLVHLTIEGQQVAKRIKFIQ